MLISGQDAPARPDAIALARRPRAIEDTGLSLDLLTELLIKHLFREGVLDLQQLVDRLALPGAIIEALLTPLRKEARIEVLGTTETSSGVRYGLTDKGRLLAMDAFSRSGYLGPAPVPLEQYVTMLSAQSVHGHAVTKAQMEAAFADIVIRPAVLHQLGPALHSGRAIMIYGHPGTGKTFISGKLGRLLGGDIFVPHAVSVGASIFQVFDPVVHAPVGAADVSGLDLAATSDLRYVRCHRPVIVSGGELTLEMLELQYDPIARLTQAPSQLKAANGIYIIDDLGRQRVEPVDLLNRWIVPMEGRVDYLTLETGRRFQVPFDVILIFSTNLNPLGLADEAFLRRLGYKIHFPTLSRDEYRKIWQQVCEARGVPFDPALLEWLFARYAQERRPLLPCQPRDLIGLAVDQALYQGHAGEFTQEMLAFAWSSYFVMSERMEDAA